jgi:hypothetical protein
MKKLSKENTAAAEITRINCRLRPGKDDDIQGALVKEIDRDKIDCSDVIRKALRKYFFPK